MGNKKTKRVFLILLGLVLVGVLFVSGFLFFYLSSFSKAAGLNNKKIIKQVYSGFKRPYQEKYLTFLILGTDQRPSGNSLLTDTILLAVINAKSGNYLLFSIPRDLWLDDLQTKINALYYYGQEKNSNDGTQLVKEKLEEIFDWPINYSIVLEMEDIKKIIDLIGGVEVTVERAFVDKQFPRDDGSNEIMTIKFKQGKQTFSGERALQFIRSRKSEDFIEGTDLARQKRQQKVIVALKSKIVSDRTLFLNAGKLGRLYSFLNKNIKTRPKLDLKILASFWQVGLKAVRGRQKEAEIPWRGEEAILVSDHDPVYGTWILRPKNENWGLIKNYFLLLINELAG